MTVVVKLGGSVITEKDRPETLDGEALSRAADAVADAPDPLVLVHGGGSFGHHHAEAHGVSTTAGTRDAEAVVEIHDAMRRLNDAVLARLHDRGVPALPVRPLSAGARDREGRLDLATGQIETMLGEGFVPVTHGDVIAHGGEGATVVSGDEVVVAIAAALDADRVGLCSSVPGVLDRDGEVIPEISGYDEVADVLGGSDATDVTGGMAAKVEELADLGAPGWIFDLAGLASFLAGGSPGTRVG